MATKKEKTKKIDKKGKKEDNLNSNGLKNPTKSQISLAKTFPFLIKGMAKKTDVKQINLILAKNSLISKLPSVNLLPEEVTLRVIHRRTKFTIALSALVVMIIMGFTWAIQGVTIASANKSYLAAQTIVAASQNRVNQLNPIQKYLDTLKSRITLTNAKLGTRLNYTQLLTSVGNVVNNNAVISTISVKLISLPAGAVATPGKAGGKTSLASQCGVVNDPFSSDPVPLVACVSFTGTANNRNSLNTIITQLSAVPFLSNVNVVQATQVLVGSTSYTFNGTVAVNDKILLPSLSGVTK